MIDFSMIVRSARAGDLKYIGRIAEETGLFPANILPGMIAEYIEGRGDKIWLVAEISELVAGFAFVEPERLTDRTWNLRAIGVDPGHQRLGIATALIAGIEAALRARNARLVVVETTDSKDQVAARACYAKRGYSEAARIPEFWEAGVSKLIFCKQLKTGESPP